MTPTRSNLLLGRVASRAALAALAGLAGVSAMVGCETSGVVQNPADAEPSLAAAMTPDNSGEPAGLGPDGERIRERAKARVQRMLDEQAARQAARATMPIEIEDDFERLPEDLQLLVSRKIEKKLRAGPMTGAAEAAAYFMDQRLPKGEPYPINRVNEIATREIEQARRIQAARAQHGVARAGIPDLGVSGELRGSDPIIDGWRALGPGNVGGRTRAMVISPAGPGTGDPKDGGFMLAAGVSGGVFKSIDGGASWRPTSDLLENIAVCTLAMDPTDPNIVYAGTGEGFLNIDAVRGLGVFKSTDAGETWTQLEGTVTPLVSPFAFQFVNKIAVSPADPLRIYAATRSGVWIHRNGGDPENAMGDEFQWELVLGNPFFLIGPSNSRGSSVGATDLQVRPAPVNGGAGSVDDEFVLAAFGSFIDDGLFASADGGESWFRIVDEGDSAEEDPFRIDTDVQGRMSIAFSNRSTAGDPGVVYVMMAKNQSFIFDDDPDSPDPDIAIANDVPFGAVFGVYRADLAGLEIERDGSNNVTGISLPFTRQFSVGPLADPLNRNLLSNALANNICGDSVSLRLNQGWYDNIIKVDPTNRNVVWAGGVDLYRSTNGGTTFELASYWYFNDDEDQYVHADQHEIVFHPDYDGASNTTMYVTNDGGIYRTLDALGETIDNGCPFPDPDTGDIAVSSMAFESINNGYEVTQFYHGAAGDSVVPTGRDLYVGGTQDNGTVRTLERRCTEDWTELLGGDGGYVAVDPTNNNRIYAETQNFGNIFRIDNNPGFGEGPRFISSRLRGRDTGLFITPFAMDPSNPGTIWTGGNRPWRTMNADESITELVLWDPGPNLNAPGVPPIFDVIGIISAIAVAPSDPDIVYVGTQDGYIARTSNGTDIDPEWIVLTGGLPTESGFISSIAVDPENPDSIWVTNARFTEFDPNDPEPDSNLYRSELFGDPDQASSWFFFGMDGFDCNGDDEINPVLPDVPAHWVAIRTCDSGGCTNGRCLVFVGTEVGVYVSEDAYEEDEDCDPDGPDGPLEAVDAVTWQMLNIGNDPSVGAMPTTVVETLDFRDDNTIVAFTHGRGAFLANILRECNNVVEGEPCSAADLVAPFGQIDLADLTAWIEDTAQGRLSADMPPEGEECGDGVLDLFDIGRFVTLQQAGCP